jgi:hypothetical protein
MRSRFFASTLLAGALLPFAANGDPAVPPQSGAPVILTPPPGTAPTQLPPTTPAVATQHFRGTLQEFDGPFLTLKTADKKTVTLGMTTATRLIHNRLQRLSDLQVGWYIGVAALKGTDGKLRAQGIRVYPANMRGAGEGEYPLDPANQARLLINGAITAVAPGGIGGTLTVGFHGAGAIGTPACSGRAAPGGLGCTGSAEIQFARGVPIIAIEGGDTTLLLPGATVSASAAANPDGTLVATTVTIERDAPPPKP